MRLVIFFSILTCFGTVWAAEGTDELVAFCCGAIVSVLAAIVASARNGGQ